METHEEISTGNDGVNSNTPTGNAADNSSCLKRKGKLGLVGNAKSKKNADGLFSNNSVKHLHITVQNGLEKGLTRFQQLLLRLEVIGAEVIN
ncbi:hypothetical protein Tco_0754950 [Tanacetum coccineum]